MRFAAIVHCSKCKQPIVSGEGFGFVYFKIPGKEGYPSSIVGYALETAGKRT